MNATTRSTIIVAINLLPITLPTNSGGSPCAIFFVPSVGKPAPLKTMTYASTAKPRLTAPKPSFPNTRARYATEIKPNRRRAISAEKSERRFLESRFMSASLLLHRLRTFACQYSTTNIFVRQAQ